MITTSCLRLRSGGSPIRAGPPEDPLRMVAAVVAHRDCVPRVTDVGGTSALRQGRPPMMVAARKLPVMVAGRRGAVTVRFIHLRAWLPHGGGGSRDSCSNLPC